LQWIADVSDGDARIALGNLELANKLFSPQTRTYLALADIRDEIKNSHMLYDKTGDEHYNTISALHKSIRASDENAAL
jgi:putative ATPase